MYENKKKLQNKYLALALFVILSKKCIVVYKHTHIFALQNHASAPHKCKLIKYANQTLIYLRRTVQNTFH